MISLYIKTIIISWVGLWVVNTYREMLGISQFGFLESITIWQIAGFLAPISILIKVLRHTIPRKINLDLIVVILLVGIFMALILFAIIPTINTANLNQ